MSALLLEIAGGWVRAGLVALSTYLVQRHVVTADQGSRLVTELFSYVVAMAPGAAAILWTSIAKYRSRVKFLTALEAPMGTSETQVKTRIGNGLGAPITAAAVLVAGLLAGASTACVRPYSLQLAPPAQTLLPASHELQSYTSNVGLSQQLERTTGYCGVVVRAIETEIDQRQRRLTLRRTIGVSITGAAGIAAAGYVSAVATPDKRITTGLGLLSGGGLMSAIPALGTDDRLTALNQRLSTIRGWESTVVQQWNALEQGLLGIALLKQSMPAPTDQLNAKYRDLAGTEEAFRSSLAELAKVCQ